jgi:hypothetical protein
MGEVFSTGKEADESAALSAEGVTHSTAQHGVKGFERIDDGACGDRTRHLEFNFTTDVGEAL